MLSVLLFTNSRRSIFSYIHQISLTYQIHVLPFKMRGVFPFCHNYLKTSNTSKSTSKRKETILSKLAEETNTIYMMLWFTKKDVAISYLTDQYIRLITTPSLPEWQEFLPEKIMILKKLGRRGRRLQPPSTTLPYAYAYFESKWSQSKRNVILFSYSLYSLLHPSRKVIWFFISVTAITA